MTVERPLPADPRSLFFVVGARSSQDTEFAAAVRFVEPGPTTAASTVDGFLASLPTNIRSTPFMPKALGHGEGFYAASHRMWTDLAVSATLDETLANVQMSTLNVVQEGQLAAMNAPGLVVSDALWTSTSPFARGWTYARATDASSCGTGTWSGSVRATGNWFEREGFVAQHGLCSYLGPAAEPLVFGLPGFVLEADGVGPSVASFRLRAANAGFHEMDFEHLSLGLTLGQLIGQHASLRVLDAPGTV